MSPSESQQLQRYARIAAILFLISFIAGGFGEYYAPHRLVVNGDAAATAQNIHDLGWVFRIGFATYLIEATCDLTLSMVFFVLLRPVNREIALLSAFFGVVATTLFAVAMLFYFAPSLILGGSGYLNSFSKDQLDSLSLLSLKMYSFGGGIFMTFYGTAMVLRGYLMLRSTYIPAFLGVLFVITGMGFILHNFLLVLAPNYASGLLLLPVSVTGLALVFWFLVKGIDVPATRIPD